MGRSGNVCSAATLVLLFCAPGVPALRSQSQPKENKTPAEWFQRASEQMNIRMPGASPFHMKVAFHAFPGDELLGSKQKPQILTGDGTYDEIWLAPHLWRREVTLGSYHAIEVESPNGRKMQASSDFIPSRVLMLMGALLYPVPQALLAGEPQPRQDSRWSIAHLSKGDISLVRVADTHPSSDRFTEHSGYYFLPAGLLVFRNQDGLTFAWQNDELFSGKVVARQIILQADGLKTNAPNRNLLTADVHIQPEGQADPSLFVLPAPPADPGETLRPLQGLAKHPQPKDEAPHWPGDRDAAFVLWGVVDRNGTCRDLELTSSNGASDLPQFVEALRRVRFRPAEIDGSPCEVASPLIVTREERTETR